MLVRRVLLAALCAAGAVSCSQDQPPQPPPAASSPAPASGAPSTSTRPRIVFLGDSLTAGLGLPPSQAFPSVLDEKLRGAGLSAQAVNAGVSGDTAAGGRRRLTWALEGDVRVLVLALGANDGLRGNSVAAMKADLQAIIRAAKARGITVLLLGMEAPPNFGPEYTEEFRKAFHDLADEEDVAFVPFFLDGVAGVPALNQSDGLHPNAEGTQRVAATVWKALEPIVQQRLAK